MRACLALLLLLLAVESRAAVGIDGANFPNGIQSHSATGVVEFGWQGVLETDNRQLRAGSIVQNTSQSPATCGSLGFCQAVAPPAPTQEPGAFPSTSGTQDVTLGYQQSGSLSGDGSNQYRRIQVGQEATLTINSGGQAFYIDRLDLGYRATLVLGSGDYWINDLNFDGSEVRVFIPAGNQVRLFVNAQVTVSYRTVLNYRDLNTPGTPDQLFIYAYNDFRIDNQVVTPAYLYSRSDFRLGNVATLRGAVTARNVTLDSSGARVIFAAPPTQTLTCFNDGFGRASLGADWVTTRRSGSFDPGIVGSSRLRLTNDTNNVATAVTLQRLFPAAGNLVEIEFTYYAYSNSASRGEDGVAVILSDSAYTPQPGSFGGSLGYAQRDNGDPGFAGGWLGVGLDEYGNFSQANEGRVGGPGFRQDAVAIRGSYPNYRYLQGTATLNPGVDSSASSTSPAPGHRYRIRIDSRLAGQALVSVERNTGSGFQGLVTPFNALIQTGQAAIPANFWLSFTGSTDGSVNNHDLDDLQVCALQMNPVGAQIDHIRIEHDGSALTCQPESVTVKACMDANCTSTYPDPVTVTLTPAAGWVGGNVLALTGGVGSRQYRRTTVGGVTFGVAAVSAPLKPFSTPKCANGGVMSSCPLTFHRSGFIFDVPDLLANKESADIALRAVRADDSSQRCVPAFESGTRKLRFWSDYSDPASGSRAVQVNGTAIAGAAPGTEMDLTFATGARTTIKVRYPDAGKMTLNARYAPTSGDEAGLEMDGADGWISSPAGFCIQARTPASGAPSGVLADCDSSSCAAYQRAGVGFPLRVRAMAWQADGESDTALCDNLDTPNFRQTSGNLALGHDMLDSSVEGTLGVTAVSFASAAEVTLSQTVSEVGRFRFTLNGDLESTYHGLPLPSSKSAAVGRFTPYDFEISVTRYEAACSAGATAFTYAGVASAPAKVGQPFAFEARVTARNAQGETTRNYSADVSGGGGASYARLQGGSVDVADFTEADVGGVPTPQAAVDGAPTLENSLSFAEGQADVALSTVPTYVFDVPRAPYLVGLELSATDSDGVTGSSGLTGYLDFRLGQARIGNAHGSELLGLSLPFSVGFFNGSGYAPNPLDSCTLFTPAVLDPYQPTDTGSGTPALANLPYQALAGVGGYQLGAPGPQSGGSQRVRLTPAPDWLKFDWDGDGTLDDPSGLATFGIYKGAAPLIFRRELYR